MTKFTPLQYIKIAAANAFGLDKETWDKRIEWFDTIGVLNTPDIYEQAKEPILLRKAINAYNDAINGIPTGYIMSLDATCSGLQIMACLIGCHDTAKAVNLIDTGKRENAYRIIADIVDSDEDTCKKPVMTYFYGSMAQPRAIFEDQLPLFLTAVNTILPGANEIKNDIQSCWRTDVLANSWTLPDGHRAVVKNMEPVDKTIEIDELDHATFTHRIYENMEQDFSLSLPANVVQSFDGYIVREMIRMAHSQGFDIITIHDCFWCSPNHMQKLRENYVKILADIASKNYLQDVLREIMDNPELKFIKYSDDLGELIIKSEYAIC